MNEITCFLNEMKRSDLVDGGMSGVIPFHKRMYNGITVIESEQSYYNKIALMYNAAVVALVYVPSEKYEILQSLINEAVECQKYFEIPSDDLLDSFIHDYKQSKVPSLKEDYDFLCFVRNCMKIQMDFLEKFKNKFPHKKSPKIENTGGEEISKDKDIKKEPIKGVKGLAEYLGIGTTKAQDILNSGILQQNDAAYRVGKSWRIHPHKLDELKRKNPNLFYNRDQ